MPSFRSARLASSFSVVFSVVFTALLAACSLAACGGDSEEDPQDRMVSELSDSEYVAECTTTRTAIGADGVIGLGRYTCIAPSTMGGTCNMNIFENCVQVSVGACLALGSTDPRRTCSATVAEMRACEVAFGAQHSVYRSSSCAMLPTVLPKKRTELTACAAFCGKCANACQ
jgi:hypothetical protein